MSFKSYATHALPDGSLLLQDPQPLVFSGRKGLIAKFVLASAECANGRWQLGPAELHALALLERDGQQRMIVFEQMDQTTLELLALESIYGVSTERTEMLFMFKPLVVVTCGASLQVRRPSTDKIYTEGLELEGGMLAPTASWHWGRPHLALGGVVCGGGTTDSLAHN
ncbi:MAG: hypothetical protein ABSE59_03020 [Opitutaceae bacterium]|jgi:hypothetical protein